MPGDFCVLQNKFIPLYLLSSSSSSHQPWALTRHPTPTRGKYTNRTHLIPLTLPLTSYTQLSDALIPFPPCSLVSMLFSLTSSSSHFSHTCFFSSLPVISHLSSVCTLSLPFPIFTLSLQYNLMSLPTHPTILQVLGMTHCARWVQYTRWPTMKSNSGQV